MGKLYLEQIAHLTSRIQVLEKQQRKICNEAEVTRRLQTMPGIGPITTLAVETFAPPVNEFRCGRDFAAWLGIVPKQHSFGGKTVLGENLKDGTA